MLLDAVDGVDRVAGAGRCGAAHQRGLSAVIQRIDIEAGSTLF